ncbi:MAG: GTP-binding protein [Methanomassiliicoccales archaeon]|jgi:G3E family GTPase
MDMMVVSGFLGSGKTTMILSTVGRVVETTKKKVVIIVNDFGDIGIDGKLMEKYGLSVTEMPSGCICCTLGSDFLETVRTVSDNFRPDLIIVEPTGIADPANIIDTMKLYRGPIGIIRTFVVVDAVRFPVIMKALGKPLKNQINAADVILINKVDEAPAAAVDEVRANLDALGFKKKVITASATAGTNLDQVVEAMVM